MSAPSEVYNYSVKMAVSQVRQNFHADSEKGINKQINMELYASYVYLSMVSFRLFNIFNFAGTVDLNLISLFVVN